MAEPLFAEFPPVSAEEWWDAVRQDLRGKDTASLNWTDESGFTIRPFYRQEDVAGLDCGVDAPRGWKIWAEARTPTEALDAIALGAEGIVALAGADWTAVQARVPVHERRWVDSDAAHMAGASPVEELALVLFEASRNPEASAVSLPAGRSYFAEIAKFRAMRRLWKRTGASANLHIHARTSRWDKAVYSQHTNILRATTEAMSAIAGGCDSLVTGPFDQATGEAGEHARRLAINTQLMLREEAYFGATADPAAGSWYIESLTARTVDAAWALFEQLRDGGGIKFGKRRNTKFVGVNLFPDPAERVAPDVLTRLPFRGALPFEQQRSQGGGDGT